MSLELVDPSKTYDLSHPSGAVFVMKHWTKDMQEEVDAKCLSHDGKGNFNYNVSLEREIKIQLSIHDWRGITFGGEEVPCTPEKKKLLPVGVMIWLVKTIDEKAGIRMPEEEKKS